MGGSIPPKCWGSDPGLEGSGGVTLGGPWAAAAAAGGAGVGGFWGAPPALQGAQPGIEGQGAGSAPAGGAGAAQGGPLKQRQPRGGARSTGSPPVPRQDVGHRRDVIRGVNSWGGHRGVTAGQGDPQNPPCTPLGWGCERFPPFTPSTPQLPMDSPHRQWGGLGVPSLPPQSPWPSWGCCGSGGGCLGAPPCPPRHLSL